MRTQNTARGRNRARADSIYGSIVLALPHYFSPLARIIAVGAVVATAVVILPGSASAAIDVEGSMDYLINQNMTNAGDISVGLSSSNNTLTIDGATVDAGKIFLGSKAGDGESNNTIRIINGAKVSAERVFFGTDNFWYKAPGSSTYIIEGAGSVLKMKYAMASGAQTQDFPSDNYVFIRDGGLVIMEHNILCSARSPYNTMKFVLDGGFMAYEGNRIPITDSTYHFGMGMIPAMSGVTFFWDDGNGNYVNTIDEAEFYDRYSVIYYETDEEAFAATGLEGMGGYTIVSDKSSSPVPESATYAAIFGAIITGFVLLRRKRRNA